MTDDTSKLVRCAGCGHNFETERFGQVSCPTCGARIWIDPPVGEAASHETEFLPPPTPEQAKESAAGSLPGTDPGPELLFQAQPPPAWEQKEGGIWRRFVLTVRQVLSAPARFFTARFSDRLWSPVSYAWIITTVATLSFALIALWELHTNYDSILAQLRKQIESSGAHLDPEQLLAARHSVFVFSAYLSPLLGLVNLFLTSALYHLGVMLIADRNNGFKATLRATAYGSTPLLLMTLPWFGQLIGGIWSLVIQVIGIAQLHHISPGRASLAVLLPITALLLLLGGALA